MADIQISKSQDRQIALTISTGIKAYVESHKEEFHNYLRQEKELKNQDKQ
ncbi:hypothetical protein M6D81_31420 [Paenibacillus sp. J5C_2022]|nr:hypothetical protein [Paenibacillus sp. J5C2022]MCU6713217.1 hypothetical protein [Paenibacillus sp. J5C2022]